MFLRLQEDEALYFLHIPKTAGMTLSNILDNYFDWKDIFPPHDLPDIGLNRDFLLNIGNYRLYRGHFRQYLFNLVQKPLVVITVLRDPIARTISNINYARELVRNGKNVFWLENTEMSLETFLNRDDLRIFQTNIQFDYLAGDLGWLESQLTLRNIKLPETLIGDTLHVAKERLKSYRVVGIQERFHDTLHLLSYELGFPPLKHYANENVSTKKIAKTDLEPALLDKLYAMNELDYQLYNTAVTLFEQRFQAMCDHLNELFPNEAGNIYTQLEAYYQQRLFQSRPDLWTISSEEIPYQYTFDQKLIGNGWHTRVNAPDASLERFVRWTGPGDEATLALALPTKYPLQVKLRILDSVNVRAREQLRLSINGINIPLTGEISSGRYLCRGLIPYHALSTDDKPQQLKLTTPASPLLEKYPGDKRIAGVCIEAIEFIPMLPVRKKTGNRSIVINFDEEMFGQNWYKVEPFGNRPSRWTGPGDTATLPLFLDPQQEYILQLETLGFASNEALNSFHIRVNTADIPLTVQRVPSGFIYTAQISQHALLPEPNYQLFQFIVDHPTPIKLVSDGSIQRILGIRLVSLKLEPVQENI
jgi:hypothetical protein